MNSLERRLNKHLLARLRNNTLYKLGYDMDKTVDPTIEATLDEALDMVRKVVRPKGIHRILPVLGIRREGVDTEVGTIQSAMFTRLVEMCRGDRSIVFMVVTLGEELERTCNSQDPIYRQLVVDTVGSELTEMIADMLESDWRAQVHRLGLQYSWRFSPGYCDWPLEGQGVIAASIDLEKIGVRLTSDFVMIPGKSVSAIAAIAKEVPIPAPCVFCTQDDCSSRRLPKQKSYFLKNETELQRVRPIVLGNHNKTEEVARWRCRHQSNRNSTGFSMHCFRMKLA